MIVALLINGERPFCTLPHYFWNDIPVFFFLAESDKKISRALPEDNFTTALS
jgi:hypothetical protein